MKKIFLNITWAAVLVLILNSSATAAGFYIGIQGGGGILPDARATDSEGGFNISYDAGFDGSITAGYDLGNNYPDIGNGRVELEFNTASNDMDTAEFVEGNVGINGSADRNSIMFNTIGEYVTRSGMIIYALLGLGWAEISLDNVSIGEEPLVNDSSSQLAYQAGLGVAWRLGERVAFDLGYRYYGTTDPEFTQIDGTSLDYEYASHRLLAGVRLHF